jgi:methylthioribose-1-phosphate isomerase
MSEERRRSYDKYLTGKNLTIGGAAALLTAATPLILGFWQLQGAKDAAQEAQENVSDLAKINAQDIRNLSKADVEFERRLLMLEGRIQTKPGAVDIKNVMDSIRKMEDSASVEQYDQFIIQKKGK